MKPELDERLRRLHAPGVGGAKGEEATRAIPPLSGTINGRRARISQLFRVTPSRLAIGYIALGVLALAILAIPLWYVWKVNLSTLKVYVEDRDVRGLVDAFDKEGAPGLAAAVDARARSLSRDEVLILADASKHRLAGNLPAWPAEVPDAPGTYGLGISLGDGSSMRVVATHVALPDGHRLLTGRESIRFQSLEDLFWYDIAGATVLVLVLGVVAGWLIRRALLSEVQEVSRTAAAIAGGDYSRRVPTHGRSDTLGALARTVNDMLDQLASQNVRLEDEVAVRRRAEEALHRAHCELEGLVAQRTAQLAQANERYALTVEAAGEGHSDWNLETGEFYISPRLLEICGYAPGTMFKDRADWLARFPFHPEDRPKWEKAVAAHLAGSASRFDMEVRIRVRGKTRWVRFVFLSSRDASGKPIRWTGSTTDITDRNNAAEALRLSEDRYARAMEGSDSGHWDWNVVTDEMFVSERASEMLALPADTDLPRTRAELMALVPMHPDDRSAMDPIVTASVASGRHEREYRVVPRPGELRWLRSRGKIYRDAHGAAVRMTGSLADITEPKLAADALRESEARFRNLTEISSDFFWETDAEHRYSSIEFGEAYVGIRDLSFKLGRARWEIPSPSPDEAGWAAHRAVLAARQRILDFGFSRIENGKERFYEISGEPRFDAEGRFLGYRGVGRDVTERKRAEQDLRRSRHYLAEAQKVSHTGSWAWSPASNSILYWSEECYRILGYDPAQGLPSLESSFERIHPEDRPAVVETIERAVREKAEVQIEYRLVLPDGTRRDVRTLSHPVLDASGELIEYLGTVVDVTEQKRAEEERREHLWFLESMDRINRAMQRTNDVELMMGGVLEETLAIFGCERACLVYPCDPDTPTWRVVAERATPQYAGAFTLDQDFPTSPEGAEMFRRVLQQPGPLVDPKLRPDRRAQFRIASMITFAVRPKGDRPYMFAMHQCSGPRAWTAAERRLFEEIARRLEDALTGVLAHRNLLAREKELRRSQHYLAEGQKLSHTGSWAWNPITNKVPYWSAESYRIYGFDPAQGIPPFESTWERVHPEDRDALREAIESGVREKAALQLEHRLVLPGGIVRNHHVRAHPVLNASGELIEYLGTVVDVTEQKRAEEERKEHLWFLECMDQINRAMQRTNDVEGMMSGVLEETLAIFASDRAWLVYPCDPDAATSRVVMEHTRPEYPGAFGLGEEFPVHTQAAEVLRRVLEGPGAATDLSISPELRERFSIQSVIAIAVRPKGDRPYLFGLHQCSYARAWTAAERRLFEEIARRLEDALTSVLAHRNLLAREEELRRSRAYLAEAQKVSHTGSWAWNNVREIVYWSEECFRIHGRDPAQGLPSMEQILADIHPDDVPGIVASLENALREGRGWELEYRMVNFADGPRTIRTIAHPVLDRSGRAVEHIGTVVDVTEQTRAEAERVKLEERLRQAEKMQAIGTLAGGIAHDFNNILGAILGYGELAQRKAGESGPLREHLDQVMQAGNRGKRLVEHILAFSRSGVGERLPVHVQSVVEETLDLLAASLPPTIRLEKVLRGGDAAVAGDATQLHQVTMNLCTNANQAMPKGGVLSVTLERTDIDEARKLAHGTLAPGPYVRLQVTDTGTGIPPAVLERIFDPFFTTKGVGEGTGLGLSLVYGIVADFGGAVDVETREGAGTTFTVWLPSCGEAPARVVDAAGVLPHGNGEAVLIVDDERPLVNIAEEILAGLGYEPVGFSSSAEALAALRADPERFDLVLTDQTMPDMTGTELASEIRRLRADIPIVLMSGYSGPELTERARAAGVSDILRKPLVSRDIAEALARVIPARA